MYRVKLLRTYGEAEPATTEPTTTSA
jgi:hypothetical protein